MDDQEYHRLKRLLVGSWVLLLGVIILLTFYGSYELRKLRSYLVSQPVPIVRNGTDGQNGYTPVKGIDYFDGTDGKDGKNGQNALSTYTTVYQPIYTNVPVPGPQGPQGPQGESGEEGAEGAQGPQGNPGIVVYVRENPVTGDEECRYGSNSIWQPIAECEQ